MKTKNEQEHEELFHETFTGISEWCDGAIEPSEISFFYYKNGEYHNEDGPALVWMIGTKIYHINNKPCSKEEWKTKVEKIKNNRKIFSK
jgi:hypothetical protein